MARTPIIPWQRAVAQCDKDVGTLFSVRGVHNPAGEPYCAEITFAGDDRPMPTTATLGWLEGGPAVEGRQRPDRSGDRRRAVGERAERHSSPQFERHNDSGGAATPE